MLIKKLKQQLTFISSLVLPLISLGCQTAIEDINKNSIPIKTLSCGGKTFILGEYIALDGGPTLIANTFPKFILQIYDQDKEDNHIHPESPAGKLLRDKKISGVNFIDPYKGLGGLGASSAQFLLMLAAIQEIEDEKALLKLYKQYVKNGSGADIVAQWKGGLTFYYRNKNLLDSFSWPFPDLGFYLIRTGHKVKTHEHLEKKQSYPKSKLTHTALKGIEALKRGDALQFLTAVNTYGHMLDESGLLTEHSRTMIQELKKKQGVLAAKGCGALGADVIFVAVKKGTLLTNYEIIATENDIDMIGLSQEEIIN